MKQLKGLTLVEVLIASSIFLVVAVTVYSVFRTGIFGFRDIEENIDMFQSARHILERINMDLRNSFIYSKDIESKFTGNEREIGFLTLVDTFSKDKIVKDYCLVSYAWQGNTLMRLCRRNQESLNTQSEIPAEELSSKIEEMAFSYGYIDTIDKSLKFKDSWGGKDAPINEQTGLPVAVKVTLSIKDKIKHEFERTVYLPLAK